MIKKIFLPFVIIIFILSNTGCAEKTAVESGYIEGVYKNDDLDVGYRFFPNGTGYQFIMDAVFKIRYSIINNTITIITSYEDSGSSDTSVTFSFEKQEDRIVMNGIVYNTVNEDSLSPSDSNSSG